MIAKVCSLLCVLTFALNARAETFKERVQKYLPNTVALDLTSSFGHIQLQDRPELEVKRKEETGGISSVTKYLDALTLTVLNPPEKTDFNFHWQFVPVFSFAFYNFQIDSTAAYFSDTDFQIFRIGAGIGPECTLDTSIGSFTAMLAPAITYSWLSWSSPASGGSMARSSMNIAIGLGYHKYIKKDWAVRFFVKAITEDDNVWNEAMDKSQGFDVPVIGVSSSIVGISLAYTF
jgi:hypothetical protein